MKSFSVKTKEALTRDEVVRTQKSCCEKAELTGLALACGTMNILGGGNIRFAMRTEQSGTARRMMRLVRSVYQATPAMRILEAKRLGGRISYEIRVEKDEARKVLEECGVMSLERAIPRHCILKKCCRAAFLKGTFLACGVISNPETGFRMEFVLPDETQGNTLQQFLSSFYGLKAGLVERKGQWVVYLRESDGILKLLSVLGAGAAILEIENARILREARNHANRAANCDTANIAKMLSAADRQLEAIERIEQTIGLEKLPDTLREIALERKRHAEVSLEELGALLEPPVGKSGVYHRLKRLEAIAASLEERKEET